MLTEENPYPYIGPINETPMYLKDNHFLKKGYRINFRNIKTSVQSLCILNNELINIWTHLIAAIFCICYIFRLDSLI